MLKTFVLLYLFVFRRSPKPPILLHIKQLRKYLHPNKI